MLRKIFLMVIWVGFGITVWAEERLPAFAEVTGKSVEVFASPKSQGVLLERLKKGTNLVLLKGEGNFWKVLYPSHRKVFIEGKFLRTNGKNMGIVLANRTGVFSFSRDQKPLTRLQKGDRVSIEKRGKKIYHITSPALFLTGYLSKKEVSPLKIPIPEKFQGVLLTRYSKPKVHPLWKQIKQIKEKLQREMAKEIGEMDLQKLIDQCGKLREKVQKPRWKRVISYLYQKARATEKMRQDYLKITAPLRKNIEKNLK